MFNKSSDQFGEAVSSTLEQAVESTILNEKFAKAFSTLLQAIADKLQDEWDKRAKIEIDHENYGLEYDEITDSYTWKKSDELGNITEEGLTTNQIQNITSKLIEDELQNAEQFALMGSENPALRITTSLKESGDMVLYEQLENGIVTANAVTELGKEEIIEAAWEPLNQILPPDQFSATADELLNQVEADIASEDLVDDLLSQVESQVKEQSTPDIESSASELLNQVKSQIEVESAAEELIAQVESHLELEQPDFIVDQNGEVSSNKPGKIIKREPSELVFFEDEENSLTGLKQKSSPNITITRFVSEKHVSIMV